MCGGGGGGYGMKEARWQVTIVALWRKEEQIVFGGEDLVFDL